MNITITIICTNALAGELSHESTIGILLHLKTHTHVTHRTINWSQNIFKGHEFMVQSQSKALTGSALLAWELGSSMVQQQRKTIRGQAYSISSSACPLLLLPLLRGVPDWEFEVCLSRLAPMLLLIINKYPTGVCGSFRLMQPISTRRKARPNWRLIFLLLLLLLVIVLWIQLTRAIWPQNSLFVKHSPESTFIYSPLAAGCPVQRSGSITRPKEWRKHKGTDK